MSDSILASKSGVVVTDANGLAYIIFTHGFAKNGTEPYSVLLTIGETGVTLGQTSAAATNLTNTGFTITTWATTGGGGGVARGGIDVYWLAVLNSND